MPDSASPLTPDAVIAGLLVYHGRFPQTELAAALAEPEAVREPLLNLLWKAARLPEDLPLEALGHRHAMLLLAQWREPRAFDHSAAAQPACWLAMKRKHHDRRNDQAAKAVAHEPVEPKLAKGEAGIERNRSRAERAAHRWREHTCGGDEGGDGARTAERRRLTAPAAD